MQLSSGGIGLLSNTKFVLEAERKANLVLYHSSYGKIPYLLTGCCDVSMF